MKKYPLFLTILALAACNKDDVITPDDPEVDDGMRPVTSASSPKQNRVYDYTPAPGQFINETLTGGFTGNETTADAAIAYAEQRLQDELFVSLGSFGGYIVVGFDHSIVNSHGDYDIVIRSNSLERSNEPGIVWVMQDTNCNGKPDDTWYQLRGSETGKSTTVEDFSVTYFRPDAPQSDVHWEASDGTSGTIDYLKAYHKQDYYYPAWISADSYTLTGTKIVAQNSKDPETGDWTNAAYGWGYADNQGSDALTDSKQYVGFKLSNAIDDKGRTVDLKYIDFVKVQQAVLAKSGWIGENSCEVLSVYDYRLWK